MICDDYFNGRQVKNYNDDVWNNERYEIMKNGLRLKFSQNLDLKQSLLATGNKNLYEASPKKINNL